MPEPLTLCYMAEVQEVHSGDDLVLLVNLGIDNLFKRVRARLYGVDTPDAHKANAETEAGVVRERVRKLTRNTPCLITVHSQNSGKGGWVVTLLLGSDPSAPSLNDLLRNDGYIYKG